MTRSRHGFTLPEVCVALTVFLVGTTALLGCWNFFNREVADERMRLEEFYDVQSAMESLVTVRPNCDSLLVSVRLTRVPGNPHLAWVVVAREHYSLKRLVRCR
ncbi:prepilin-type N-terminal cleavage/methylation domain-containing protein [Fibrobacter sp.]|uniref:type IV pilus modification PilV family protein n=1 Tax=Fibrobacter sp. TaxID=35828 RepID=UPI003867D079